MARKKKENPIDDEISNEKENSEEDMDIFKEVDKMNPDATFLSDEDSLSFVEEWIDTDCYALNVIMSGTVYGGIPMGRVTGLCGQPGTGKTLIALKVMANAQKNDIMPIIWDSENAYDSKVAKDIGCDISKIKIYPIDTIEDCRNQICKVLDKIAESDKKGKYIIVIDSLGNLFSSKEENDVEKGKSASDVGARAKALKSMLRVLTNKAGRAKVPIIYTNHIYESMDIYSSKLVKKQSGGYGPIYNSSLIVQLSVSNEKNEDDESEKKDIPSYLSVINAVKIHAMTVKNRFIPSYLKTTLSLHFRKGLNKYSGLLEIAEAFGMIRKEKNTYYMGEEKLGYAKNFENNSEFWEKNLEKLDNILKKELKYSHEETNKLKEEIDEIDDDDNNVNNE